MKNKLFAVLLMFAGFTGLQASDKMYIDADDFETTTQGDAFHIHIGNNVWLVTNTIHMDTSGMFAFESNLSISTKGGEPQYEKKWKCPYCYQYWPIGKPCGNKDCASRYK